MELLTSMKIRGIKCVLTLQNSTFANTNSNTKTIYAASLPGYLHAEVNLQRMASWLGNNALICIYGMTYDDCNSATKFNSINVAFYNQVQVYAGYLSNVTQNTDGSYNQNSVTAALDNLPLVFLGEIISAGVDFNNPDRPFVINSNVAAQALSTVISSSSINQQTTLSAAITSLINTYNNKNPQIKYQLKSVTPDQNINNFHQVGTVVNQLQVLCDMYGYQIRHIMSTSSPNTMLLEFTKIGTASGSTAQVLNADNGMIGYPKVLPFGIGVMEYFNPNRSINDLITLDTYYTAIKGNYYVWQQQACLQTNGDLWQSALTLFGFNNSAYST